MHLSPSPASKLLYLLLFLILGSLLAMAAIGLLYLVTAEKDLGLWMLYISMITQAICMFVLPVYFTLLVSGDNPYSYLGLSRGERLGENTCFVVLIFVAAYLFVLFLTHWNKAIAFPESMSGIEQWMRTKEDLALETTNQLLSVETIGGLLMNLLIIGVVASVGEEIIFRGALQQFLQEWTKSGHAAVWISAFIFSAIHFQFYGFLPRLFLGVLLGYLFLYTRNLWIPIFVHFLNNGIVVLFYFFWKDKVWFKNMKTIEITPMFGVLALASLVATVFLLRYYVNRQKQLNSSTN